MDPERMPVIVGIGEIVNRPEDPALSHDPLALMAQALKAADADGGGLLARIDSIDIVHQTSWAYEGTAQALCARAGISPARAVYGVTGGESPVRYIHQAAMRIAAGESNVAAVVGAEAQYARARAKKAGIVLPWPERAPTVENRIDVRALYNPLAMRHEVMAPAEIYPLYEHAATHAWGQSPAEALAESGTLWERFSATASENPYAWSRRPLTADQIMTPTATNRMVAWPYTKSMVANPQVNQGAAVIIASLAEARRAGVPEDHIVHLRGGAFASEPRDYLARDGYTASTAQEAVLRRTRALASGDVDLHELYSCFPIVPKMARRTLGLGADFQPTVTGGLSFFGAPLNNYMTHAACAMVRALRAGRGDSGLLYGQGEFVTKHHALLLAREPGAPIAMIDAQAEADAARGPVPALDPEASGPATLESFTLLHDREGKPRFAMIVARTPRGNRAVARLSGDDEAAIARLTDPDNSPIGASGTIEPGEIARWTFAG